MTADATRRRTVPTTVVVSCAAVDTMTFLSDTPKVILPFPRNVKRASSVQMRWTLARQSCLLGLHVNSTEMVCAVLLPFFFLFASLNDCSDQCEPPPNFRELADTSDRGQNVNGSLCLNNVCMYDSSLLTIEAVSFISLGGPTLPLMKPALWKTQPTLHMAPMANSSTLYHGT